MLSIILALLFYSIGLLLLAFASRSLNSTFVAVISNFFATIIPIGFLALIWNRKIIENAKLGILFAVLAGVSIAFYSIYLNKSFETSKVGLVTPIVFGGAIFLTTILGTIFFKEKISILQGVGLALIVIGILFIIYVKAVSR